MVFLTELSDRTDYFDSSPIDRLNQIISIHLRNNDINNDLSELINSTKKNEINTNIDHIETKSTQLKSNDENEKINDEDNSNTPKNLVNKENETTDNKLPSKCRQESTIDAINLNILPLNEKNLALYKNYKMKVSNAVRQKKIFLIYGNYKSIRAALLKRGWLEKLSLDRFQNISKLSEDDLLNYAKSGNDYETVLISKMLNPFPPNFIWQPKYQRGLYDYMVNLYRNHIKRARSHDFATKDGLITCIQNYHWNHIDGVTEVRVPKYHTLDISNDLPSFLQMYRITYCLSLLRFISEKCADDMNMYCENGEISDDLILFAIDRIQEKISELNNEEIDDIENIELKDVSDENWNIFIENCDKIIMKGNKFKKDDNKFADIYKQEIEKILTMAKQYWPTIHMDGYLNLWIMKPACQSRGCGIFIMKNYANIVEKARKNPKLQYIVQKYIERPLLIYKTKFDIRQHILITITEDYMNIWFYKDCYLRFSSREFSLDNLTESVHLTNNYVQKKYKNGKRSNLLPANNMWTSQQFCDYLKSIDQSTVWEKKIYPSMKANIIAIVLGSLEETEFKKKQFELYGCDFMLDENFDPILLEINSAPDMTPSTSVTAKLCPLVLHDTVKVVVDLNENSEASTGNFELIHKIRIPQRADTQLNGFEIIGKKIKLKSSRKTKNKKIKSKKSLTKIKDNGSGDTAGRTTIPYSSSSNSVDIKTGVQQLKKCVKKRKLKSSTKTNDTKEKSTSNSKGKKSNPKDLISSDKIKRVSSAIDIIKRSVEVIKTLRQNSIDNKLTRRLIDAIYNLHEKGINFNGYSSSLSFHNKRTVLPTDIRQGLAIKFNNDTRNMSSNKANDYKLLKEFLNILY